MGNGTNVGTNVGRDDGRDVGKPVGKTVGIDVGKPVENDVGKEVGKDVGANEELTLGCMVVDNNAVVVTVYNTQHIILYYFHFIYFVFAL